MSLAVLLLVFLTAFLGAGFSLTTSAASTVSVVIVSSTVTSTIGVSTLGSA